MNAVTEPVQLKRKRKLSTMEGGSEGEEDESEEVGHTGGSEWCVAVILLVLTVPVNCYSHMGLWNTSKRP